MIDGVHRIPFGKRRGVKRSGVALVDAGDAELVSGYAWGMTPAGYLLGRRLPTTRESEAVYLHRLLLGLVPGDGLMVDHIDRDRLNNRRANLRVVVDGQHQQNQTKRRGCSSRFRGVSRDKRRTTRPWHAYGGVAGRRTNIGMYATEEEAGVAAAEWRAEHMPFSAEATQREDRLTA